MSIKNSFINIDTSLWENAIARNFNIDNSAKRLLEINNIAPLDLVPTKKDEYGINIVIVNSRAAYGILNAINNAIDNLEKYKVNTRIEYANILKHKRDTRKFYQFWLNKSDKAIDSKVSHEFSWMGSLSDLSEYYYFIMNELVKIQETLEMFLDLKVPKPINILISKRNFSLFLHFCNDESFNIL